MISNRDSSWDCLNASPCSPLHPVQELNNLSHQLKKLESVDEFGLTRFYSLVDQWSRLEDVILNSDPQLGLSSDLFSAESSLILAADSYLSKWNHRPVGADTKLVGHLLEMLNMTLCFFQRSKASQRKNISTGQFSKIVFGFFTTVMGILVQTSPTILLSTELANKENSSASSANNSTGVLGYLLRFSTYGQQEFDIPVLNAVWKTILKMTKSFPEEARTSEMFDLILQQLVKDGREHLCRISNLETNNPKVTFTLTKFYLSHLNSFVKIFGNHVSQRRQYQSIADLILLVTILSLSCRTLDQSTTQSLSNVRSTISLVLNMNPNSGQNQDEAAACLLEYWRILKTFPELSSKCASVMTDAIVLVCAFAARQATPTASVLTHLSAIWTLLDDMVDENGTLSDFDDYVRDQFVTGIVVFGHTLDRHMLKILLTSMIKVILEARSNLPALIVNDIFYVFAIQAPAIAISLLKDTFPELLRRLPHGSVAFERLVQLCSQLLQLGIGSKGSILPKEDGEDFGILSYVYLDIRIRISFIESDHEKILSAVDSWTSSSPSLVTISEQDSKPLPALQKNLEKALTYLNLAILSLGSSTKTVSETLQLKLLERCIEFTRSSIVYTETLLRIVNQKSTPDSDKLLHPSMYLFRELFRRCICVSSMVVERRKKGVSAQVETLLTALGSWIKQTTILSHLPICEVLDFLVTISSIPINQTQIIISLFDMGLSSQQWKVVQHAIISTVSFATGTCMPQVPSSIPKKGLIVQHLKGIPMKSEDYVLQEANKNLYRVPMQKLISVYESRGYSDKLSRALDDLVTLIRKKPTGIKLPLPCIQSLIGVLQGFM